MVQKFDSFNRYEVPQIFICNPNKKRIGVLSGLYDIQPALRFNEMSEFNFSIPYSNNGELIPHYDTIISKKLIEVDGVGFFLIQSVEEFDNGLERYKTISSFSLEAELSYKKINLLDGTYKFYDVLDPEKTLLGLIFDLPNTPKTKNGWVVGEVDVDLMNKYRTFEIPDATIYNFLMSDVEEAYECVFTFDTYEKTVNAYSVENYVKKTSIMMTYENLLQEVETTELAEEIVTCLGVYGGGELDVRLVNPLGTSKIYNFNYFMTTDWMSQELIDALVLWQNKVTNAETTYGTVLVNYKEINQRLIEREAELVELQTQYTAQEGVQKVRVEAGNASSSDPSYVAIVNELNRLSGLINTKNNEISNLTTQKNSLITQMSNISKSVSFERNFSTALLEELNPFIIENTYQNDSFIKTSIMSEVEIQNMAQELYDQGKKALERVSQPRFEFKIDSVNFLFQKQFLPFINELELGSIITIQFDELRRIQPVLLQMEFQYDDPEVFTLTFGTKYRLDSAEYAYSDLFESALNAATSVDFNGTDWGWYVNSGMNDTVSQFINSALDATKNNIINAENQEILINTNGLHGRQYLPATDTYSPERVWLTSNTLAFTKDNWNNAALAIGKIRFNNQDMYGVVGDAIVGKILAGNQLTITNENNNFTLDSNGAVLTNASFTLTNTTNMNKIIMNPSVGFRIQKNTNTSASPVWKNMFYIDTSGNVRMEGNITATSGNIGGWQIRSNGLFNSNSGDYIRSDGYGRLSVLTYTPSTATFNGYIYAANLRDQVQNGHLAGQAVSNDKILDNTIGTGKINRGQFDALYASRAYVQNLFGVNGQFSGSLIASTTSFNNLNGNVVTAGQLVCRSNILTYKGLYFGTSGSESSRLTYGKRIGVKATNGNTYIVPYF